LNIGNTWVFEKWNLYVSCTPINSMGKYKVKIISDTLMPNGKKYFVFSYYQNSVLKYQRLDTITYKILGFDNSIGQEKLLDSLFAKKDDWYYSYRISPYPNSPTHVSDTGSINLFGSLRKFRAQDFSSSVGYEYYLTEGIGLSYLIGCEGSSGSSDELIGCVINGVLYGDTSLTSINTIGSEIPSIYSLYQNYPNPFNPTTKIKFDIPTPLSFPHAPSGNPLIRLKIYDILGKEIATLVKESLQPGSYEVTFDGNNLPSGIYFYKLETNNFVQTKKLILLK